MSIRRRAVADAALLDGTGVTALVLSVAAYAAVSVGMGQPFHAGGMRLRFFDLRIYHLAALRLAHGVALYGAPMLHGLGFTYPPFAALVLAPLAWLPLAVDELVAVGVNVVLLVVLLRLTLRLAPDRAPSGRRAWAVAAALAAAALWLEPVSVTLGYGQVNLLIAVLVVLDLSRPDGARGKGVGIGLAAAIKLTPLFFIPYLLLSRRPRAAATATATFAAAIALSFVVAGRDAATYWWHDILQTSRVGDPLSPADQSLRGGLSRLTGSAHLGGSAELVIVAVAVGGLALAVEASRRGDEAAGFSLAALTALLVSPISWSHHWTLAVPALVLLGWRARARRSVALAAAAAVFGLVGYAYLPELAEGHLASAHGIASLAADPYPVVGLLVLVRGAVTVLGGQLSRRVRRPVPARRRVPRCRPAAVRLGVGR